MASPLLFQSATRLAREIRNKEVTSREVVDAHIARTEAVNPSLNAVVRERFADARKEADAADARVAQGNTDALPPFFGVPCTLKEVFSFPGFPNTSGMISRRGASPTREATAVTRLRQAGAIPIGMTNVSELCMWMETNNRVYGRTNNPYDTTRIVGGSSGGEGAIVGAGGSPFGLGSDIGGSIRMPAFFNGVFGHKPSGGLVPATGQYPIASNEALRYLTTGPLARRAEDLMPLLRVLAGPDGEDSGCSAIELGDPKTVRLDQLHVLDVTQNGFVRVAPVLQEIQQRASSFLASRGARVVPSEFPDLKHSFPIWSAMLEAAGGPTFSELLSEGRQYSAPKELLRWAMKKSDHTLPAILLTMLEPLPKLMPDRSRRYVQMGHALKTEITRALGPNGVMLYPSYAAPAPKHYWPLTMTFSWVYTAILNVLELPATQVPLGLDANGLPIGVQVVAAHGNDHLTIAVAEHLETAFGGWTPPPSLVL